VPGEKGNVQVFGEILRAILNEARGKYGIHGPLEEPLRQLKYLANKSETKDLGTYVTLDRDLTQPKLSDGEEISFIDQLNLWANKYEKDKTEKNATPAKPESESWLWKLYEKTLKVIVDAVLGKVWHP
jgi:hypothetical protein